MDYRLIVLLICLLVCSSAMGFQEERPNPYKAQPNLSAAELVDFLESAERKPNIIRRREPFQRALVDAAERVLKSEDASDEQKTIALKTLFRSLYQLRTMNAESAGKQLGELAEEYLDDSRPEIRSEAQLIDLEAKAAKLDLNDQTKSEELLEQITEFFTKQERLGERHLDLASEAVKIMNNLSDGIAAADAYVRLGKLFSESDNRELSRYGKKLTEFGNKLALTKKPIEIEGPLLDGGQLDWSKYKGKVVLVEFWATWCGPCIEELPNVKENYKQYHDQGFEVVGISLDKNIEAVREFVDKQGIPWEIVVGEEQDDAMKFPMAEKFSVRAIPKAILIGRDGKAIHLNARGETLDKKLAEVFEKK